MTWTQTQVIRTPAWLFWGDMFQLSVSVLQPWGTPSWLDLCTNSLVNLTVSHMQPSDCLLSQRRTQTQSPNACCPCLISSPAYGRQFQKAHHHIALNGYGYGRFPGECVFVECERSCHDVTTRRQTVFPSLAASRQASKLNRWDQLIVSDVASESTTTSSFKLWPKGISLMLPAKLPVSSTTIFLYENMIFQIHFMAWESGFLFWFLSRDEGYKAVIVML